MSQYSSRIHIKVSSPAIWSRYINKDDASFDLASLVSGNSTSFVIDGDWSCVESELRGIVSALSETLDKDGIIIADTTNINVDPYTYCVFYLGGKVRTEFKGDLCFKKSIYDITEWLSYGGFTVSPSEEETLLRCGIAYINGHLTAFSTNFNSDFSFPEKIYLRETGFQGRPEIIEKTFKGEEVWFVIAADSYDPMRLEVRSELGSLGFLPSDVSDKITPFLLKKRLTYTAKVTELVRLSNRNKHAKSPIVAISIKAERTSQIVSTKQSVPHQDRNKLAREEKSAEKASQAAGVSSVPDLSVPAGTRVIAEHTSQNVIPEQSVPHQDRNKPAREEETAEKASQAAGVSSVPDLSVSAGTKVIAERTSRNFSPKQSVPGQGQNKLPQGKKTETKKTTQAAPVSSSLRQRPLSEERVIADLKLGRTDSFESAVNRTKTAYKAAYLKTCRIRSGCDKDSFQEITPQRMEIISFYSDSADKLVKALMLAWMCGTMQPQFLKKVLTKLKELDEIQTSITIKKKFVPISLPPIITPLIEKKWKFQYARIEEICQQKEKEYEQRKAAQEAAVEKARADLEKSRKEAEEAAEKARVDLEQSRAYQKCIEEIKAGRSKAEQAIKNLMPYSVKQQCDALRRLHESAVSESHKAQKLYESAEAESDEARHGYDSAMSEYNKAQKLYEQAEADFNETLRLYKTAESELTAEQGNAVRLQQAIQDKQDRLQALSIFKQKAKKQLAEQSSQLQIRLNQTNEAISAIKRKVEQLMSGINTANSAVIAAESRVNTERAKLAAAKSKYDDARNRADTAKLKADEAESMALSTAEKVNLIISPILSGKITHFGHLADGTPISWMVLGMQDNCVLLISQYALDLHLFDQESSRWDTSDLRKWLNNDFLTNSFSGTELKKIAFAQIPADLNPSAPRTISGTEVNDKIFLLSLTEAKLLFDSDPQRKCTFSDQHTCMWWLRSPGTVSTNAANINVDGKICCFGKNVGSESVGVRPALWLRLGS